jgi:glycerol-3-phosphate acyltransferase PlsY
MIFLMIPGAYLIGAVPAGYLLFKSLKKMDIRKTGSGNIGATNVLRSGGWKVAVPVLLFDIGKGFLPAWLASRWFIEPWAPPAAALAAVLGHCFPVYIGFRGGKGVATTIGAFLAVAPVSLMPSLGIFLLLVALTRFVSLGSMAAAAAFPVSAAVFGEGAHTVAGAAGIALLVIVQHRANLSRLLSGTERKLGEKPS